MNILVICREIPPVGGGAGHVAINLAQTLEKQGDGEFHIITMAYGSLPEYEKRDNIHIYRVNCLRRYQDSSYLFEMGLFLLRAVPLGRKLLVEKGISLIHAHAIIPDGLIGLLISKSRVPVVVTAHGSDVPGYNPDKFQIAHKGLAPLWHWILKKVDKVVTPSNHLAGLIRKKRAGQEVSVIPNGIEVGIFSEESLGDKKDEFLIVSRLVKRKNYHLFLSALRDIPEPQTVHIVGEGPELERLKNLAKELEQHNVIFHGWLKNGSLEWKELYQRSSYFVFPSESENFPINLLEAMLAEMVILASDIPGNREVVGDNGIFFKGLTVERVREEVRQIIEASPEILVKMGGEGRILVKSKFSWLEIGRSYLALYQKLR